MSFVRRPSATRTPARAPLLVKSRPTGNRAGKSPFGGPGGSAGASGVPGPRGPGRTLAQVSADGDCQAVDGELVEQVGTRSAALTRNLPLNVKDGQIVTIHDVAGLAGQYPITIKPGSGDTLDEGGTTTGVVLDSGFGSISFARTSGGDWVNFADGRQFEGVQVGKYMAYADGNFRNAFVRALAKNPNEKRFILPRGDHLIGAAIINAAAGMRSNLIIDGVDPQLCRVYRTTAGGCFSMQSADAPTNLVFKNTTYDVVGVDANFNSMIFAQGLTGGLVDNCRLLCTLPNVVTVGDGINHQVVLEGFDIVVRNSYFDTTQCKLGGTGFSSGNIDFHGNQLRNCNDLGVSVVSGDGSGLSIKNVHIHHNRFDGLHGAGYIYVGNDGLTTPDEVTDVEIDNNICTGPVLISPFAPAGRIGIYVVWGVANKRIKVHHNQVSNTNPSVSTPIVVGIALYSRDGVVTSVEDVLVQGNSTAFTSNDGHSDINVSGPVVGLRVLDNFMNAARGLLIEDCDQVELSRNYMKSATTPFILAATNKTISDVRIYRNHIEGGGSFKEGISVQGTHNVSRVTIDFNRIISNAYRSVFNRLTGGATLDFRYRYNSHDAGLDASAVPAGSDAATNYVE